MWLTIAGDVDYVSRLIKVSLPRKSREQGIIDQQDRSSIPAFFQASL